MVNLENLKFLKSLLSCIKIICLFVKVDQMFTKPPTRAPPYKLIKCCFLAISLSYLHDLSHTFLKRLKLL